MVVRTEIKKYIEREFNKRRSKIAHHKECPACSDLYHGCNLGTDLLLDDLVECVEALQFTVNCVDDIPWIKEGPKDITNPMFLGTGSVDGDEKVHQKYLRAKQLLERLENKYKIDNG